VTVAKFVDDETLPWPERFKRLQDHHIEETTHLLKSRSEVLLDALANEGHWDEERQRLQNQVTLANARAQAAGSQMLELQQENIRLRVEVLPAEYARGWDNGREYERDLKGG
jgi:serine phosphatase RsbU (regulator of sigma subunit)